MATFLRRKFAGLMKKDDTPPSLTLTRPEGPVTFSKKELQRYTQLLMMLDNDADEQVGGAEGAMFLRRSGLSNEQLREVWRLASGGTSKQRLGREEWLIACKLVAAVQFKGVEPSVASVVGEALPLADFHYGSAADVDVEGLPEVPHTAVKIVVTNPTSFGSGLSKHTRYSVITTTTLPHLPRREMTVWRRFSDFEWLHHRLSLTYPAAIIPIFPEKRMVGNTDDSFVSQRMSALESYMNKIVTHPALTTSMDLLVFLDATDDGLEAAKCYIESVVAEESDSLLSKAGDMVSSLASRDATSVLVIKPDEEFISACASHGHTLARLSQVVKAGTYLSTAQHDSANTLANIAKSLVAIADHERAHASAGASVAAQVAAAAASSKRAQQALFSGSAGPAGAGAVDNAAAQAFASHTAAAREDNTSIDSMFKADFHDPYSALHSSAPQATAAKAADHTYAGGYAEYLPDLLAVVANQCNEVCMKAHEHTSQLDTVLLEKFRLERDKEAELGEAIKRRDAAIERVQEANATVQRRKKAVASLKPGTADYATKNAEAQSAAEKADKNLAARREELEKMTEVLKNEMARTNKNRRIAAVNILAEHASLQAAQAKQRANIWSSLLPAISNDAASIDGSRELVASIARKAEAKARAASAARAKTAPSHGVLSNVFGGPSGPEYQGSATAGSGTAESSAMPVFADDAPIPKADEL